MGANELLLPPAARLVHIGPFKTGTSSVQSAFHTNRRTLRRHGVHYAGATVQPLLAAVAVAGGRGMKGDRAAHPQDWTELLDEVRDAGEQRVVISSEFLCYADAAAARRVVSETPGGPVHVVVTLRPVSKIAPSQWQQYVQNGLCVPYPRWLNGMFRQPPYEKPTPSFWRRHSHGELVRRWAEVAGPENLTVIVADESDPGMLLHTFEAMLGLPDGALVPSTTSGNRSLSRGEVELVRLVNRPFARHDWSGQWSTDRHAQVVRRGVVRQMKTGRRPAPDEPRLRMPEWASERAAQADADTVEVITSLGVRVVGDLAGLAKPLEPAGDDGAARGAAALVPADAAALAVLGAINARGGRRKGACVAAALAVLDAACRNGDSGGGDSGSAAGMPLIPTNAAARAVLEIIEPGAANRRVEGAPATALVRMRPVFEALGVRLDVKNTAPLWGTRPASAEKRATLRRHLRMRPGGPRISQVTSLIARLRQRR
jgi:hypothetical protein